MPKASSPKRHTKLDKKRKLSKGEIGESMKSVASSKTRIHVISQEKSWAVKRESSSRASRVFPSKHLATEYARQLDKNSDVIIHKKDGKIQKWYKRTN